MQKINFESLKSAARDLTLLDIVDIEIPPGAELSEVILHRIHHALFEVHILEGELKYIFDIMNLTSFQANLVCPQSGRKFGIHEGIPNMILHEDEI